MVGPAGATKLSAFWNMCFSKPPHFGNRGAAHVVVVPGAVYADKKYTKTTAVYVIKKLYLRTSPCHTQLKASGARTIKKHWFSGLLGAPSGVGGNHFVHRSGIQKQAVTSGEYIIKKR